MRPNAHTDGFARKVRRSVSWYALKEYANGALWVIPAAASLAALAVGFALVAAPDLVRRRGAAAGNAAAAEAQGQVTSADPRAPGS